MLDIKRLMRELPCKKVPAGGLIEYMDATGRRAMYILIVGRVSILNGLTSAQTVLYPQEVFGGHSFFGGEDGSLFIADVDSVVGVITEDTFLETVKSYPEIAYAFLRAAYVKPQDRKETADQLRAAVQIAAMPQEPVQPAVTQKPVQQAATKKPVQPPAPQKPVQQAATKKPVQSPAPQEKEKPDVKKTADGFYPAGHRGYPGIVHPEYAKLVFVKIYTCPFCGRTFDGYRMFLSKLINEKPSRYDLRTYYKDFRTEWYEIVTCPHCLFSMFHNYFTEPKPLAKDRIKEPLVNAQKSILLDFQADRDIGFVFAAHYLALRCADGYGLLGRQIRAKLWGNLSWLYEDVEETEMERYAAEECAKAYEALYMNGSLTTAQEQNVCLTIAGMLYRAGINDNLMKYLFMAKTSKAGNRKYMDLADDLRELLREKE